MKRRHSSLVTVLIAVGVAATVAPAAGAGARSALDGVYRFQATPADLRAIGVPEEQIVPENYGTTTFVFDRGRFAFTTKNSAACIWAYGRVVVTKNRVELRVTDGGGKAPTGSVNKPGEHFVYGWKFRNGRLTLSAVAGQESPEPYRGTPMRRLTTAPARSYLDRNCRPPAKALS
jgi:hypothetical protein